MAFLDDFSGGNYLQQLAGMNPSFMQPGSPQASNAMTGMGRMLNAPWQPGTGQGPSYEDIQRQAYERAGLSPSGPRRRSSLVNFLGGLADTFAELGGEKGNYQATLDREDQQYRQARTDDLNERYINSKIGTNEFEMQAARGKLMGVLAPRLLKLYQQDPAAFPQALNSVAQSFGLSPEQVQAVQANPELLQAFADQAERKFEKVGDNLVEILPDGSIREAYSAPAKQEMSDDIREYEYAFQGVPPEQRPAFTDWLRANKGAGATKVSVNAPGQNDPVWGEAQPGFAFIRGPDGKVMTAPVPDVPGGVRPLVAPMGGTKEDYERNTASAKAASQAADEGVHRDIVVNAIDQAGKQASMLTTGIVGNWTAGIPGTPAHDLQQTVETIKANISIGALNRMRQQSPTGGALGNVTEGEHRLLSATLGALEQSQSLSQFKSNLAKVKAAYNKIVNGTAPSGDAGKQRYKFNPETGDIE